MTNSERVQPAETYNPRWFKQLAIVEQRHFWFRARNEIISTLVKQTLADLPRECLMMEVGCGTGNVLRSLQSRNPEAAIVGVDLHHEGLMLARKKTSAGLVQADIASPPFRSRFHLIGLFDVLEHMPDDNEILRTIFDLLMPGGKLFLTVPAHASLWSYFDVASNHQRRYQRDELREKLQHAGYQVEYLTHYMALILPLVMLRRLLTSRSGTDRSNSARDYQLAIRELRVIPIVNEILFSLLSQEKRLLARRYQLIGTSLVAVACKPPCP